MTKPLWALLAIAMGFLSLIGSRLATITPSDIEEYDGYFHPTPHHSSPDTVVSKTGVRKDLWLYKEGKRGHYVFASPTSQVILPSSGLTPTETFQDLRIYIQGDAFKGGFPLAYEGGSLELKTPKGEYNYSNHTLQIGDATFAAYEQPLQPSLFSERKLDDPIMAGNLSSAKLCLDDQKIQMQAEHFHATMFRASPNPS